MKRAKLDFVQPFDGSQPVVPSVAQDVVAGLFAGVVDGFHDQYPHAVKHVSEPGGLTRSASLKVEVPRTLRSKWNFGLIVFSDEAVAGVQGASEPRRPTYADVSIVSSSGRQTLMMYGLDGDGIVRRTDEVVPSADDKLAESLGVAAIVRELRGARVGDASNHDKNFFTVRDQALEIYTERFIEPNHRFAVQMGFNGQPVGIDEMSGLVEVLHHPKAKVVNLNDL